MVESRNVRDGHGPHVPITRARFVRIDQVQPGQILLRTANWYLAEESYTYLAGVPLVTKNHIITPALKAQLEHKIPAGKAVLVGDVAEGARLNTVAGCTLADIADHLEHREKLFQEHGLHLNEDGTYPSLFDNAQFFNKPAEWQRDFSRLQAKPYRNQRDVHVVAVIDGAPPAIDAITLSRNVWIPHAKNAVGELFFQQKYFFGTDRVSALTFGEGVTPITPANYERTLAWNQNHARQTAQSLEASIALARGVQKHTHIYLVLTGPITDSSQASSVGEKIKSSGIELTVFPVGDACTQSRQALAQMMLLAEAAGGDIHPIKGKYINLLGAIINAHFERYRAGIV